MKTAVIQLRATADKKRNVARALRLIENAVKERAQFILLPEMFNYRGRPDARTGFYNIAEAVPGESTRPFMDVARREKVFILLGSIAELVTDANKVFNTSVLINDRGTIAATYRKINLFDAVIGKKRIWESDLFCAGTTPQAAYVKSFAVGLSICYDIRFPELYREYARLGANMLCVPSCFTKQTGAAHWEVLLRARAIENLSYVLAPNQAGSDARGINCYGNSMIVSPWGEVIARASGAREGIIYATLQMARVSRARKQLPSAIDALRKPDSRRHGI